MDDTGLLKMLGRRVVEEEEPIVSTRALEAVAQRADSGLMMTTWLERGESRKRWKGERDIVGVGVR